MTPVFVTPPPSFIEFDREDIDTSIPTRFEKQVAQYPDRIAIKTTDQTITYRQLNQAANRLAHAIIARRAPTAEPVLLLIEPGPALIIAILAVVKAGKFWTTLDPALPQERMAYIRQELEAGLLITDNQNVAGARQLSGDLEIINRDDLDATLPVENLRLDISPDALAYVLYTSGSTGRPKGVMHSHRNVLQFLWWHTNVLGICREDRLSLLASFSHISGITATFRALLNGATVLPYNLREAGLLGLATWLMTEQITLYHSVPTVFRHFVDTLSGEERFPKLRLIHLGGEPVSRRDVEMYKKYFADDSILLNNLGSTETSTIRQFFMTKEIGLDSDLVPVGYGIPDKELLLLNEQGQAVPPGEVGEMVVKSDYLALGYWRQPDLTAATFIPDPDGGSARLYHTGDLGRLLPDGRLIHLGRKDSQIKIRGQRVEIGEIEATLLGHPQLKEAATAVQEGMTGQRLVAYVVPWPSTSPTTADLHTFLSQKLPSYMVPSEFIFLESLPLLPNRKINRKALPKIDPAQTLPENSFIEPRDGLELQVVQVWEKVLGHPRIGVKDNFFDLGGHSLSAATLMFHISKTFKREVSLATLFQAPTVEQMAQMLRQTGEMSPVTSLIPLRPGGSWPPFFCLPGNLGNVYTDLKDLVRYLGDDQPVYGLQDGAENPAKIEALAQHYIKQIRTVQAEGPYYLGGLCAGGVVAYEMAQQLQRQGEKVALLALIEPAPPRGLGLRAVIGFGALLMRRFLRRFSHHSGNLVRLSGNQQKTYARLKTKLMANSWALRRYTPRPYPGSLHLFLTEDSLKRTTNPQLNWRQFSLAETRLHKIPGNHDTITGNNDTPIEADHMEILADQLTKCFRQATAENRPNGYQQQCVVVSEEVDSVQPIFTTTGK